MRFEYGPLREDLKQDCYGAAFIGGFGGAMIESFDIDDADEEELFRIAKEHGFDLDEYNEEEQ